MAGDNLLELLDLENCECQWSTKVPRAAQLAGARILERGRRRQLRQLIAARLGTNVR